MFFILASKLKKEDICVCVCVFMCITCRARRRDSWAAYLQHRVTSRRRLPALAAAASVVVVVIGGDALGPVHLRLPDPLHLEGDLVEESHWSSVLLPAARAL